MKVTNFPAKTLINIQDREEKYKYNTDGLLNGHTTNGLTGH